MSCARALTLIPSLCRSNALEKKLRKGILSFVDLTASSERFIFLSYLRDTPLMWTTSYWGPFKEERPGKNEGNTWRKQRDEATAQLNETEMLREIILGWWSGLQESDSPLSNRFDYIVRMIITIIILKRISHINQASQKIKTLKSMTFPLRFSYTLIYRGYCLRCRLIFKCTSLVPRVRFSFGQRPEHGFWPQSKSKKPA